MPKRYLQAPGVSMSDFGAEAQCGGPAGIVEVEHDPLALAEHAEDRTLERIGGEVELGEVGVADDDCRRPWPGRSS